MSAEHEIQTQGQRGIAPSLNVMQQTIGPHAATAFARGVITACVQKMIETAGKEATFEFLSRCADEIGTVMIEAGK